LKAFGKDKVSRAGTQEKPSLRRVSSRYFLVVV